MEWRFWILRLLAINFPYALSLLRMKVPSNCRSQRLKRWVVFTLHLREKRRRPGGASAVSFLRKARWASSILDFSTIVLCILPFSKLQGQASMPVGFPTDPAPRCQRSRVTLWGQYQIPRSRRLCRCYRRVLRTFHSIGPGDYKSGSSLYLRDDTGLLRSYFSF